MAEIKKITWKKVSTGVFDAYVDGVKTDYNVVNGCRGLTGRETPNFYIPLHNDVPLVKNPGTICLSLKAARQIVEQVISRKAKEGAPVKGVSSPSASPALPRSLYKRAKASSHPFAVENL
jgi:hypothetical protein